MMDLKPDPNEGLRFSLMENVRQFGGAYLQDDVATQWADSIIEMFEDHNIRANPAPVDDITALRKQLAEAGAMAQRMGALVIEKDAEIERLRIGLIDAGHAKSETDTLIATLHGALVFFLSEWDAPNRDPNDLAPSLQRMRRAIAAYEAAQAKGET